LSVFIRSFIADDMAAVIALWDACGITRSWNDPRKDIDRKVARADDCFLVAQDGQGKIIGTVMFGYDGHRGNAYHLCVETGRQREKVGTRLMREMEKALLAMGCPKINIMVRRSNIEVIGFYKSMLFTEEDILCLGRRLIDDSCREV